jgi:type II secretory pathway pseudopilin PulG
LVEVVAVAAIASVVIALLVFVLRPSRGKGLEAHFRAELQQLCAAVNMYMGDYDDRYPLSLRALKKHLPESPTKPTGLKKALPGCYSSVYYNFTRNIAFLKGEARYNAQYPFDVRVDPVIKAPFFCKTTGTIEDRMFLDGDGKPFTKRREA